MLIRSKKGSEYSSNTMEQAIDHRKCFNKNYPRLKIEDGKQMIAMKLILIPFIGTIQNLIIYILMMRIEIENDSD